MACLVVVMVVVVPCRVVIGDGKKKSTPLLLDRTENVRIVFVLVIYPKAKRCLALTGENGWYIYRLLCTGVFQAKTPSANDVIVFFVVVCSVRIIHHIMG